MVVPPRRIAIDQTVLAGGPGLSVEARDVSPTLKLSTQIARGGQRTCARIPRLAPIEERILCLRLVLRESHDLGVMGIGNVAAPRQRDGAGDVAVVNRPQSVTDWVDELREPSVSMASATVASTPEVPSIAVLPFADMSPEKDQDYFCEGMAEEIINALTKLKNVRVVARTSAFQFKGQALDLREAGRRLGVTSVLEGSVRKAGDRLRATAQLINVQDGYHLWSERFDRRMDDVFDVQDDITHAVVDGLKIQLFASDDRRLVTQEVDDVEAYDLFLKGRYHINRATKESIQKGLDCLSAALEREPDYARAYAGQAIAHVHLGWLSLESPRTTMAHAQAATDKAMSLDDALDEAHNARAYERFWYGWDWAEAEREYRRTLQLNPNHVAAHHDFAYMLACLGRAEESLRYARRAVDLDPLSPMASHGLAVTYGFAGHYAETIEQERRTLELDSTFRPAYWALGTANLGLGRFEDAIESLKQGAQYAPDDVPGLALLAESAGIDGAVARAAPSP